MKPSSRGSGAGDPWGPPWWLHPQPHPCCWKAHRVFAICPCGWPIFWLPVLHTLTSLQHQERRALCLQGSCAWEEHAGSCGFKPPDLHPAAELGLCSRCHQAGPCECISAPPSPTGCFSSFSLPSQPCTFLPLILTSYRCRGLQKRPRTDSWELGTRQQQAVVAQGRLDPPRCHHCCRDLWGLR